MTVRRCSVEVYPAHWVPSVSVWACDACGQEATTKGWPDDPPEGWYCSLEGVRVGAVRRHCCSFACTDQLDGLWTKPPIGHNPVYSTVRLLRAPIRGFQSAAEFAAWTGAEPVACTYERYGKLKGHGPRCDLQWCYCYDENDPDPMCDCGEVGWACRCDERAFIGANEGEPPGFHRCYENGEDPHGSFDPDR